MYLLERNISLVFVPFFLFSLLSCGRFSTAPIPLRLLHLVVSVYPAALLLPLGHL